MKSQSKKKIGIRTKQSRTAQVQATPALLARIPGIKPPVVNACSAYRAAQFVDPLGGTPERPTGEHVATSRPKFIPPTLAKSLVDVDAYEGLMVFRFQGD